MTSSNEYSPFLQWNREDPVTATSIANTIVSLASMLRDGYDFDKELTSKVPTFLRSFRWNLPLLYSVDEILKVIGQTCTDPATVFVDSLVPLLSWPSRLIVDETITTVRHCFKENHSTVLALVSSKIFSKIHSSQTFRGLSKLDDLSLLKDILMLLGDGLQLCSTNAVRSLSATSDTDPQSIRDVVLNEVLIPIGQSLVQISRNRHLLSWNDECRNTVRKQLRLCDASEFHQPTLDFICSSRIPMVVQSLLTSIEHEFSSQLIIWDISTNDGIWKTNGTETVGREGLIQALEQEGFSDSVELTLLYHNSSENEYSQGSHSLKIMKRLGMNSPQSE
ncbi:hypothetical protein BLNAU_10256 [Blattamonas nauphoetae]|uniref:Uncharacterized protein n=1 Tax=Blattamonas nauphoetae TaxID=2049346 RepID=A0ABQ9XTG7_9EUKA|nr:hypothetical protein BLNAU_10256 [Blattamonas nauphoetae]